jgi:hypothetical protein
VRRIGRLLVGVYNVSGEAAVSRRLHRVVGAWSHPNRYRYRDRDRLGSRRIVGLRLFPDLISPAAQPAQHRGHPVEFGLAILAFGFVQRLANNQNVLYRGAFQGRTPRDLEVASPVRIGRLPVALGNVHRYRLTGAQPWGTR